MKTYLSIDLDYWAFHKNDSQMYKIVTKAISLKVPKKLVREHNWLVSHVNESKAQKLINIDYHDDICVMDRRTKLTDGTWASFINWRGKGHFEWWHPHGMQNIKKGICDPDYQVYGDDMRYTGWKKVKRRRGIGNIPWDDVVSVGIAISPDYLNLNYDYFYTEPYDDFDSGCRHYNRILQRLLNSKTVEPDDLYRRINRVL